MQFIEIKMMCGGRSTLLTHLRKQSRVELLLHSESFCIALQQNLIDEHSLLLQWRTNSSPVFSVLPCMPECTTTT